MNWQLLRCLLFGSHVLPPQLQDADNCYTLHDQDPKEGETPTGSFALVLMDVDTVDAVLRTDLRIRYSREKSPSGERIWRQQELNP